MRYCLRCRRLSGAGPVCTSCGGSFGGKLCDYPRTPHLNPPGARFCGQCGSTVLREAAGYVPLSWIGGIFKIAALLALAWVAAPPLLRALGNIMGDPLGITRYADWRVWALETFVPLLLPLAFLYWITGLLFPGRSGRQARGLLTRFLARGINLVFDVLGGVVKVVTRLLLNLLDRNRGGRNGTGL